jgi:hypothetical protein
MEEALFLFQENHECYKQEGQEPCIALWIQLAGYKNTAYISVLFWVKNINFVPNTAFQMNGETL